MKRASDLTDGYALATPDNKHYVFYAEDTDCITMDLSKAREQLPAVAVGRFPRRAGPASEAAVTPAAELKPCTIELVDGRKLEGRLPAQCQMPGHLIVVSPRLATVRSFLKKHVHALTVAGERRQFKN